MAGSAFNTFVLSTTVSALQMNQNYQWIQGDLIPFSNASLTNNVYDLGSATKRWRNLFCDSIILNSATISNPFDTLRLTASNGTIYIPFGGVRGGTANNGAPQEIATGTVSTPDFRSNAASLVAFTGAGSAVGTTTLTTVSLTTLGGPVLVIGHVTFACTLVSDTADIVVCANRNGTAIAGAYTNKRTTRASGAIGFDLNFFAVDFPAAGSYSYNLMKIENIGSINTIYSMALTLQEFRA